MSEYTNVEHPFLEKLREIGWQVIDKGSSGAGEGAGKDKEVKKRLMEKLLGEEKIDLQ